MIRQLWRRVIEADDHEDEIMLALQWSAWLLGVEVNRFAHERSILVHIGPLWLRWVRVRFRFRVPRG